MIDLRFVPLDLAAFPGGARKTRRASTVFSSKYQRTLDRLEHELDQLKAVDVIIQAGYIREDIRNDGWPRSTAQAKHPAVVLSFRSREANQEYSFPCDTFTRFEHNLHAIAFTLEALRAVNRYGVTRGYEQYKGFAQLAAPPDESRWSVDAAAEWLASMAPGFAKVPILESEASYRAAYKRAAMLLHPDSNPGAQSEWHRLQQAKTLLDQHFAQSSGATA